MSHTETNHESDKNHIAVHQQMLEKNNFVSLNQVLVTSSIKFAIIWGSILSAEPCCRQCSYNVKHIAYGALFPLQV